MRLMNKIRLMIFLIFILLIFMFYYFGMGHYLSFENIKQNRMLLQEAIERSYFKAVIGFMGIYIALTSLTLPFAVLFTIVGGFLFGTFWGAVYSCISATIGSSLSFLLVRYLIGHWIHIKFGDRLKNFRKEFKIYGYSYLLSIHFASVVPLFIINIFASMANISYWTFVWTTVVGIFPGFLVYAFAGKQFAKINTVSDIFSWKIFLAFLCLALLAMTPVLIRKIMKKKNGLDYVEI